MKHVTFRNRLCEIHKLQYGNGRIALKLVIARGRLQEGEGEPMAVATVNLPDEPVRDGYVFIKDYAENEGMYDALLAAGVISPAIKTVKSGFVLIPMCKYLGGEL